MKGEAIFFVFEGARSGSFPYFGMTAAEEGEAAHVAGCRAGEGAAIACCAQVRSTTRGYRARRARPACQCSYHTPPRLTVDMFVHHVAARAAADSGNGADCRCSARGARRHPARHWRGSAERGGTTGGLQSHSKSWGIIVSNDSLVTSRPGKPTCAATGSEKDHGKPQFQ